MIRDYRNRPHKWSARNQQIIEQHAAGLTLAAIAKLHGISPARAGQIDRRHRLKQQVGWLSLDMTVEGLLDGEWVLLRVDRIYQWGARLALENDANAYTYFSADQIRPLGG